MPNYCGLKKGVTSQMDLANKAELDRTYIGGVERDERNIALKNIEKIAKNAWRGYRRSI